MVNLVNFKEFVEYGTDKARIQFSNDTPGQKPSFDLYGTKLTWDSYKKRKNSKLKRIQLIKSSTKEINDEEFEINEMLKKVNGKWALVSKKNPKKILQYYRGHKGQKPSEEWVKKVERRVHMFDSMGK